MNELTEEQIQAAKIVAQDDALRTICYGLCKGLIIVSFDPKTGEGTRLEEIGGHQAGRCRIANVGALLKAGFIDQFGIPTPLGRSLFDGAI